MIYMLPPHVWIAVIANGVIVLDVRADRYMQLGNVAAGAIVALTANRPLSNEQLLAARSLASVGILTDDGSGRPVASTRVASPLSSALEQHSTEISRQPGMARCALAVLHANTRIKVSGLAKTLAAARERKRTGPGHACGDRALSLAQGFARRRSAVPIRRSCLPDSLALFRILVEAGIDVTLVIGVRVHPFAAHCWVQTDDYILSDAVAPIRELEPILAI